MNPFHCFIFVVKIVKPPFSHLHFRRHIGEMYSLWIMRAKMQWVCFKQFKRGRRITLTEKIKWKRHTGFAIVQEKLWLYFKLYYFKLVHIYRYMFKI